MLTRRLLIASSLCFAAVPARAAAWTMKLAAAAEAQIGKTVLYDPAYVRLAYPGGDVPMERGVCTDVVIRAYRNGLGIDLQKRVHEDMRAHFSAYPRQWGLAQPDSNIDHRRVPNLQTYFKRNGAAMPVADDAANYQPGDLVTMMLPSNLPHIAIIIQHRNDEDSRPLVVHNIGAGARLQDVLFSFPVTGHYRYDGTPS